MKERLARLVTSPPLPAEEVGRRTRQIHETVRRRSPYLIEPNFTSFHPADLRLMFQLYDEHFFNGDCGRVLPDKALSFHISRRMTSAAGKTTRHSHRSDDRRLSHTYSISVSATLLFQNLHETHHAVRIGGLVCQDRLEALQRVMEHELIHLLEMVLWRDSSCSRPRFRSIAGSMFGHTEHVHRLITPRERAYREKGVHVGSSVSFEVDGLRYRGVVNRITKRATVLVEDPNGPLYSDGKRYVKYYVPLSFLQAIDASKKVPS